MKIENTAISLSSHYQSLEEHTVEEKLEVWNNNAPQEPDSPAFQPDSLSLSFRPGWTGNNGTRSSGRREAEYDAGDLDGTNDPKILQLRLLLAKLFGNESEIRIKRNSAPEGASQGAAGILDLADNAVTNTAAEQGWGMEYSRTESYYERQDLELMAEGTVTTEDERTIDFSYYGQLSREFRLEDRIVIQAGSERAIDPLMINFNGPVAELTEAKYLFDLDSDGDKESISFAPPDSGFLFLDLDGDGAVTDGRELFGPKTGSGFGELAGFDMDGNGWIDENDAIFNKLKIWAKNPQGIDAIYSLKDKGVGALYLGYTESDFKLKDQLNNLQGEANRFGVFLHENGTPGTLEEVDLVV